MHEASRLVDQHRMHAASRLSDVSLQLQEESEISVQQHVQRQLDIAFKTTAAGYFLQALVVFGDKLGDNFTLRCVHIGLLMSVTVACVVCHAGLLGQSLFVKRHPSSARMLAMMFVATLLLICRAVSDVRRSMTTGGARGDGSGQNLIFSHGRAAAKPCTRVTLPCL